MNGLSEEQVLFLVNHIFLPIKLTSFINEKDNLFLDVASCAIELVSNFLFLKYKNESYNKIKLMIKELVTMQQNINFEGHVVSAKIKNLKHSEIKVLPLFLKEQNACVIFKYNQNNKFTFSAFQTSASNAQVMGNDTDLIGIYPKFSLNVVNEDILVSTSFGNQLADLARNATSYAISTKNGEEHNEIRDVPEPKFVFEWLSAVLIGSDSSLIVHQDQMKIVKKIRDDIVYVNKNYTFRRAGIWMAIKVVVQIRLCEIFGEIEGKLIYKIIISIIIKNFCDIPVKNFDLKLQMIKKLARRIYKLDLLAKETRNDLLVAEIIDLCAQTIEKENIYLKRLFEKFVSNSRKIPAMLDMKEINSKDRYHNLDNLQTRISYFRKKSFSGIINQVPLPHYCIRNKDESFPNTTLLDINKNCLLTTLYDIECWVQRVEFERLNKLKDITSFKLKNLIETYIEKASQFYENDEIGNSRMILTCIKIVCLLDKLALNKYSLLSDHKIGISIEPFESLLIPLASELMYCKNLISYINSRNNENIPYDSLVDSNKIDTCTFSVRYASRNKEMQKVKHNILKEAERKKNQKLEELKNERIIYYRLSEEANKLACEYKNHFKELGVLEKSHDPNCKRCEILSKADGMRVKIYEEPLPDDECRSNAVIFELLIPESICYLRDVLHIFRTKILGLKNKSPTTLRGIWIRYNEIKKYAKNLENRKVTLGSFSKLNRETHYEPKHPKLPNSDFFYKNAYSVSYCDFQNVFTYNDQPTYNELCIFNIEEPYDILQWAVSSTTHTENQVLSHQSKCPKNLSLKEFIKYGSFRAGHRLQTRNLLDAIETRGLSFKNKAVYSLIAQSIWQVGPLKDNAEIDFIYFYPSSHYDFSLSEYMSKLNQILSGFLEINIKCWNDHLILLNIVIITSRAISLSLNVAIKDLMVKLMLRCRKILSNWLETVLDILKGSTQNDSSSCNIKEKLFEISCFIILTYYTDKRNQNDLLLNSNEHVVLWFTSMRLIYDNKIISEKDTFKRNLYRRVTICLLEIEDNLKIVINYLNKDPLTSFLKKTWPDANDGKFEPWLNYEKADQWYFTTFRKDKSVILIQLCLNGSLLIQGKSIDKLPESIYKHADFLEYFDNTNFDVLPSSDSSNVYVTQEVSQVGVNRSFSFSFIHRDSIIIIEKRREENHTNEYVFIPKRHFESIFPNKFVYSYSHWLNTTKNIIEFRNQKYSHKSSNSEFYYELDLKNQVLQDFKKEQFLIDIKSKTFEEIYKKITFRMEIVEFVHVFYYEEKKNILIELPRMGLTFEIDDKRNVVMSKDYIGMKVSESQQINTLLGLEKGLLLCEDNGNILVESNGKSKKQLLIPNGIIKIKIHENTNIHHQVDISFENISSPSFYLYEMDMYLKKLRADESINSWFYLAWLHASTSHVFPDPFLGQTGTEMSIQLLQSSNCWSAKPLNDQGIDILNHIAELSPTRVYYPNNKQVMQNIEWPNSMHAIACHDAYYILVQKIISDSERLCFAFRIQSKTKFTCLKNDKKLSRKSYNRYKYYYSNLSLLAKDFAILMNANEEPVCVFDDSYDWKDEKITNARKIIEGECKPSLNFSLEKLFFPHKESFKFFHRNYDLRVLSSFRLNKEIIVSQWNKLFISSSREFSSSWFLFRHASLPSEDEENLKEILKNAWLDLYIYIKNDPQTNERNITHKLLLSFLAYKGVSLDPLLFLQQVSINSFHFCLIEPPVITEYATKVGYEFDENYIRDLLNSCFLSNASAKRQFGLCATSYASVKASKIPEYVASIKSHWNFNQSFNLHLQHINYDQNGNFQSKIDQLFQSWSNNKQLFNLITRVQTLYNSLQLNNFTSNIKAFSTISRMDKKLKKLKITYFFAFEDKEKYKDFKHDLREIYKSGYLDHSIPFVSDNFYMKEEKKTKEFPKFEGFQTKPSNDSNECNVEKYFQENLKKSWESYMKTKQYKFNYDKNYNHELIKFCNDQFDFYTKKSLAIFEMISRIILKTDKLSKSLIDAELWPRLIPSNILKWLNGDIDKNMKIGESLVDAFGSLAVIWSLEQRIIRIIGYMKAGDSTRLFLKQELFENIPHKNWSPREYPQWLIFELEQNIMIKNVQIDVAMKMLNPSNNKNTVMQLNMGEGKTSVIIPLLVTALNNGKTIPRVVVLKSLFNMNFSSLSQKLGGILNKRVYLFPCQRDIDFNIDDLMVYKSMYNECLENKGIIISLPEHQLSFKLKGLELSRTDCKKELSKKFIEMQMWLDNNTRDILDESDELLNVKYQLVYPVGNNTPLDGGKDRWLVAQMVLNVARNHFANLKREFGDSTVEFINEINNGTDKPIPQAYPQFRLLDDKFKDKAYDTLCEKICIDILKGKATEIGFPEIKSDQINYVKNYILKPIVEMEICKKTSEIFPEHSSKRKILQILRGYFIYGVLNVAFSKRWKVDYGINSKRTDLLQAVPYRAKDVPADRAQFAHPDIFILLTQLSYFYSGLTNHQLDEVFDKLSKCPDATAEYKSWIEALPVECKVDDSIKEYLGINLNDLLQKFDLLYPLLRFHPTVINYWLCEVLYPKEAKQFSQRLGTSAWDLCQIKRNSVTGFSGTNESRLLLPLTINYHEIPELKGTNGMLISYLLLPENNKYSDLPANINGKKILKKFSKESINLRLLLDIGALMIDLNNKQVIEEWLDLRRDIKAGVYFDEDNNLQVIDRYGRVCLLEISPFRKNLNEVVVYLDEFHTRGTDIRFPYGTIGAVTLGKGVTKDRLMQGCMRLRMLGHGHSVHFFASNEVHQKIIKNVGGTNISTLDILSLAIHNSRNHIIDGFLYWATNGLSSFRRESVFQEYNRNRNESQYFLDTIEHETVDLENFYGHSRKEVFLKDLISNKIKVFQKGLPKEFEQKAVQINQIINEYVPNHKIYSTSLEEEEESELENEKEKEQEEEKEIERPPPAAPLKNQMTQALNRLVESGKFNNDSYIHFLDLPKSLNESSLKKILQHKAWSKNLLTTPDFAKTVQIDNELDCYLRPPRWMCIYKNHKDIKIILISDYEANELFPKFKTSPTCTLALLLPRIRQGQERIISFSNIVVSQSLIEQIGIYSGSLYFNKKEEQDAFLSFISYCPGPRTEKAQKYFDSGFIKNGYVPLEHRKLIFENSNYELSEFIEDPNELIIKLYELRNYSIIPRSSHHLKIISLNSKIFK